jgi:hypothetical protein
MLRIAVGDGKPQFNRRAVRPEIGKLLSRKRLADRSGIVQ